MKELNERCKKRMDTRKREELKEIYNAREYRYRREQGKHNFYESIHKHFQDTNKEDWEAFWEEYLKCQQDAISLKYQQFIWSKQLNEMKIQQAKNEKLTKKIQARRLNQAIFKRPEKAINSCYSLKLSRNDIQNKLNGFRSKKSNFTSFLNFYGSSNNFWKFNKREYKCLTNKISPSEAYATSYFHLQSHKNTTVSPKEQGGGGGQGSENHSLKCNLKEENTNQSKSHDHFSQALSKFKPHHLNKSKIAEDSNAEVSALFPLNSEHFGIQSQGLKCSPNPICSNINIKTLKHIDKDFIESKKQAKDSHDLNIFPEDISNENKGKMPTKPAQNSEEYFQTKTQFCEDCYLKRELCIKRHESGNLKHINEDSTKNLKNNFFEKGGNIIGINEFEDTRKKGYTTPNNCGLQVKPKIEREDLTNLDLEISGKKKDLNMVFYHDKIPVTKKIDNSHHQLKQSFPSQKNFTGLLNAYKWPLPHFLTGTDDTLTNCKLETLRKLEPKSFSNLDQRKISAEEKGECNSDFYNKKNRMQYYRNPSSALVSKQTPDYVNKYLSSSEIPGQKLSSGIKNIQLNEQKKAIPQEPIDMKGCSSGEIFLNAWIEIPSLPSVKTIVDIDNKKLSKNIKLKASELPRINKSAETKIINNSLDYSNLTTQFDNSRNSQEFSQINKALLYPQTENEISNPERVTFHDQGSNISYNQTLSELILSDFLNTS